MTVRVFISIGSNIDAQKHIRIARNALLDRYGNVVFSSVYESKAVGFDGEDFLNLVAGFETKEPVEQVRQVMSDIEQLCQRSLSSPKFSSRTLDMDLLTYGATVAATSEFTLPRDEILNYAFVLQPLAEIAPLEQHPLNHQTYQKLWADFDDQSQQLHRIKFDW